jgi:polyphosphate kinase
LRKRLKEEILAAYLADTAKTRMLEPNGDYRRARGGSGKVPFSAQDFFMQLAEGRAMVDQIPPPVEMGITGGVVKTAAHRPTARKKATRAIPPSRADVAPAPPA